MPKRPRALDTAILAVSSSVFVGMMVVLSGRIAAPGISLALSAGVLGVAALRTRGIAACLRRLDRESWALCAAGGSTAVFAAPALVAWVRLTDAPAGSVVVFWMSAGWAALVAVLVGGSLWRHGDRAQVLFPLAGAMAIIAGSAGTLANWERPSSFSPLVTFPARELCILGAGALFVSGLLLVGRASRRAGGRGAVVASSIVALAVSIVWCSVVGFGAALSAIAELPVPVAIAAVAWGFVVWTTRRLLVQEEYGLCAAALGVAPIMLSALSWVEQVTGALGPRPFVVPGLTAGVVLTVVGVFAVSSRGRGDFARAPLWARFAAAMPLVAAAVALALPAIHVAVNVNAPVQGGAAFIGTWNLAGWESVAGLSAVALALTLVANVAGRPSPLIAGLSLAACLAWLSLRDVPMHVLTKSLAPTIQSYYGTPYGSITFTAVPNLPMAIAVAGVAVGSVVVAASTMARSRVVRRPNAS